MSHIFKKNMLIWAETIKLVDLGEKKLSDANSYSNQTIKLYRHKSDGFAEVWLVRI